MRPSLEPLRAAIQHNCDIADASHARNFTLCTYLLKMREYYRWEKSHAFTDILPKEALGEWLAQREQHWETIEGQAFARLRVNGREFDPFDSEAINRELLPHGLVYSSGYGQRAAAHFFLGELLRSDKRDDFTVLVSGAEHARDLAAPPAMMLNGTIFVRRESLRRLLWERIEEWQWRRTESAMARALANYDFERKPEEALEAMTDREIDAVILHETGEGLADRMLGPAWNDLLLAVAGSQAELMARAVRDHLADSLSTLPHLLEDGGGASLHFYFANFKGMRRELAPNLDSGYRKWVTGGGLAALEQAVAAGADYWRESALQMLSLFRQYGAACKPHIEQLPLRSNQSHRPARGGVQPQAAS
ncbi:MAG: Sfum_1244 family protein [Burkholderiales bacterium]